MFLKAGKFLKLSIKLKGCEIALIQDLRLMSYLIALRKN